MDSLVEKFNAISPHVQAIEINTKPHGDKQTLQVKGGITGSDHQFTYHSLEHKPEDIDEAIAHVVQSVLRDHSLG